MQESANYGVCEVPGEGLVKVFRDGEVCENQNKWSLCLA